MLTAMIACGEVAAALSFTLIVGFVHDRLLERHVNRLLSGRPSTVELNIDLSDVSWDFPDREMVA